jgi:hypothetical protein
MILKPFNLTKALFSLLLRHWFREILGTILVLYNELSTLLFNHFMLPSLFRRYDRLREAEIARRFLGVVLPPLLRG